MFPGKEGTEKDGKCPHCNSKLKKDEVGAASGTAQDVEMQSPVE